jgi:hypothetical protein
LFGGPLPKFKFSPETVRKALSKQRMGGTCLISICGGGETLLPPEIVDYIKAFLEEGHYVHVVTNGTTSKKFDEMAAFSPELLRRLFFKFSYHYMQLKEKNLLDIFFANINKMHKAGASFTLEATPSDEMIPYIEEMKEAAIKNVGAINHVTVSRDERVAGELPVLTDMSKDDYRKTWKVFDSPFFNYKMEIFGEKRREFCYAGAWSLYVNLATGVTTQCYKPHYRQNIFDDIKRPVRFLPVGNNCREKHCYNGHALLTLGCIPELTAPTYAEMRNRVCHDGKEWLYPEVKSFFESRLYESNTEYTDWEKFKVNSEIKLRKLFNIRIHASWIIKNLYKWKINKKKQNLNS